MRPDLAVRATGARELMDDRDADPGMLDRTYLRFETVNALVSRPGRLYRRDIRPRSGRRPLRILDVGSGGGDLCRLLASRSRRDGVRAEITALDPDPRATAWALAHDGGAGIRYRAAHTSALVEEGARFDVVLSNHLLHHLAAEELTALLHDSRVLAGSEGLVVHSDIARSRAAYALFAAATLPFASTYLSGSFIRGDGLISIRRSYTASELRAAAPEGWRVRHRFPSRLELRWEGGRARP